MVFDPARSLNFELAAWLRARKGAQPATGCAAISFRMAAESRDGAKAVGMTSRRPRSPRAERHQAVNQARQRSAYRDVEIDGMARAIRRVGCTGSSAAQAWHRRPSLGAMVTNLPARFWMAAHLSLSF